MRTAVRVRAEVAVRHRSMVVAGIGGCGQLRLALAATVRRSIPGRYAFTVQRLRRRRRRCRSRAGPGCRGHGHTASSSAGPHGRLPPGHRGAAPRPLCGGDERVPQRVGRDLLGDPGAAGGPADDPPGAVPVQPPPVCGQEQRSVGVFAHGQVDRPGGPRRQRRRHHLAALMRVMVRVRCPRSRPRCSVSAPVASETRSPFSASSEISACPAGGSSPAATRSAPSSLRSRATA